ncbi:MAG TPA: helix-turn-helix domain-containing protein [Cellulomonadaceae bacterium]|jgi:FixJ family two-component response regulator|nr:helix-turn-helix domain-containing protein [Cellulomonadaceae bacterium]
MSRRTPYRIELTVDERERLERRVRRQTAAKREVFRAQVVLLAATGLRNDEIANRLGTVRTTVSRWRKRFFEDREAGLADRPRSGRPRAFSPSGGRRDQGARLRATD